MGHPRYGYVFKYGPPAFEGLEVGETVVTTEGDEVEMT